jgi:hypothetical protein
VGLAFAGLGLFAETNAEERQFLMLGLFKSGFNDGPRGIGGKLASMYRSVLAAQPPFQTAEGQ